VPITWAVRVIVTWLPVSERAMPKSITLTSPVLVSMMFAGLMSRCTMPLRWL
jgi:hypothetical protein